MWNSSFKGPKKILQPETDNCQMCNNITCIKSIKSYHLIWIIRLQAVETLTSRRTSRSWCWWCDSTRPHPSPARPADGEPDAWRPTCGRYSPSVWLSSSRCLQGKKSQSNQTMCTTAIKYCIEIYLHLSCNVHPKVFLQVSTFIITTVAI